MQEAMVPAVQEVWDHTSTHSFSEAGFPFPFILVAVGPEGMFLVLQHQSLDQAPTLLLQHFPMSEAQRSLPQGVSVFCRELAPVHVRIVRDKQTKQPRAIRETSAKRRAGGAAPQPQSPGMELSRGRGGFAGGRG